MATTARPTGGAVDDSADLAQFGYEQRLHRRLHFFSSFAAAFSYISPATGIFTLFILGVGTLAGRSSGRGGWWCWGSSSWP